MRVGAIDIGSNSVRLLVADVPPVGAPGNLLTVARAGESCRLARGLDQTGQVDGEMAERAAVVSADFARRARALGAGHMVAGATAALRRAANGADVAALIGSRTGLSVRILSGEEEARLVYEAVVAGLGAGVRRSACIVFDLGGGSTEVVSGIGHDVGRWVSIPFGAVSLTERIIRSNPLNPEDMGALEAEVDRHLMHDCAAMPESAPILAGVGGTVTVLASLDREIKTYDPAMIEGWVIKAPRLEDLTSRVALSTSDERDGWLVLGKGRSDIVVAGALVIRRLARRFRATGLVCSTHGLRYGLARLAANECFRQSGDGAGGPGEAIAG
jgi:exopolyphosphatase/guanosine-5'-triphosphate,3'-diphosphate pyrophosphatase